MANPVRQLLNLKHGKMHYRKCLKMDSDEQTTIEVR